VKRRSFWAVIAVGMVCFTAGWSARSKSAPPATDLAGRMDKLESAQRDLLRQLQQEDHRIWSVENGAHPGGSEPALPQMPSELVSITQAHLQGAATGEMVLIEFSDFQCPFCAQYARDTYPLIKRDFIDTGILRYAFWNFPIDRLHPLATELATGSECAAREGRFWEMHDRLFENPQSIREGSLAEFGRIIGLNPLAFSSCLRSGEVKAKINSDMATARRLGITATPAFFIGVVEHNSMVRVVKRLAGAQPYPVFRGAIELTKSDLKTSVRPRS